MKCFRSHFCSYKPNVNQGIIWADEVKFVNELCPGQARSPDLLICMTKIRTAVTVVLSMSSLNVVHL